MQVGTETVEKKGLKGLMLAFGPGIIYVLGELGAADLVNASISGSSYGYSLMWILPLSLIIRFVIVNIMSRYQLSNSEGFSIIEGFRRVHKFFPIFIGFYALIMGHLYTSYMISGAGEALAWLFRFDYPFIWSVIVVLSALFVIRKNVFNTIENVMKVFLVLLTLVFIGLAIWSTPSMTGIIKGTLGFDIPADVGFYGAVLMAISLAGSVTGSVTNFLYPYYMKEKGWVNPLHKKLQRNDLLFATFMSIIIILAIWIVGAEILRPNNIVVSSINDISMALSLYFGYFGSLLFYIGVFAVVYSSIIAFSNGLPKVIVDALHQVKPERKKKYGEKYENDPMFKWFSLFILVTPIIWSIPGMPGVVTLAVYVNVLGVIGMPAILIGILILSNQKTLGKYRNNWFENILLVASTLVTLWLAIAAVVETLS
ncbi:Mn2+/Fe2+ transporter [Peribacillus cavernae]|uniref:Mn2+/Fe2+ transporter n=1 Tax=Peribacillus cavernae TaxID=1674310 RepID=A0A433HWP0_9BACI|nr:Nramp family divalent metal transporter [Peribacillus cavernae]MDQ0218142.1 Mn2+/Fe2+ NRAMP family transporter [Peribacillus cavernae]RUQ32706.1 Mn2+/Fe2+ transporter [Peribacillus cavernae]